MFTITKKHVVMARTLGVAIVATLGLAACATYDDEFAGINSRLDQLDTRVQGAAQSDGTRTAVSGGERSSGSASMDQADRVIGLVFYCTASGYLKQYS